MSNEFDSLIANAALLIQNVSRDLEQFAELNGTSVENTSTANNINTNSELDTSLRASTPNTSEIFDRLTPSPVYDLDFEIERINLFCENVDRNLRSVGIRSSRDEPEIIDLSETPNDSNDLVVVGSEPVVVDLCTPGRHQAARRGRRNARRTRCSHTSRANRGAPPNYDDSILQVEVISASTAPAVIEVQQKHNVSHSTDDILKCPVCMESAYKNQPTSTKCGHVFCGACIRQAIHLTRKCPMCNTKMTEKSLLRLYV